MRCHAYPQYDYLPFPEGSVAKANGLHGHKDGQGSDFLCRSAVKEEVAHDSACERRAGYHQCVCGDRKKQDGAA